MGVNYAGSDTFKTKLGALVSFLTYVLILLNLAGLLMAFFDGSKQEETMSTSVIDRFSAGNFSIEESQFEFAILRFSPLPINIGRLVAE